MILDLLKIILKNRKMSFVSKTRQCLKFRICSKMENQTLSWKRSRTPIIILILKKVQNWELLYSSCLINVGYSFYNRLLLLIWAEIPKTQSFNLCLFLTLSVKVLFLELVSPEFQKHELDYGLYITILNNHQFSLNICFLMCQTLNYFVLHFKKYD